MLKLIKPKYLNLGQNNLFHSNGITGDLKGGDLTINAVFWRDRVTLFDLYLVQRIPEDLLFVRQMAPEMLVPARVYAAQGCL